MTTKLRLLTAVLGLPAAAGLAAAQGGLPPIQSVPFNGSPVPPTAPVPPVGSPVGIGSYPRLPTDNTLWSFLGLSQAQAEYRQRALADTPFGELRSKIREPLSDLTGGLIPPIPPKFPALADLMDPGAVGAAAKVKLDREMAKKRIKAVQYLTTVDCHYWPEAEDALVGALRADRNEWVRLAAAQALLKGCCCTKKTILALTMAATCSNADGNPTEKSPRVVAAAQAALSKCLEGLCCNAAIMAEAVVEPVAPVDDDKKKKDGEGTVPKGEGQRAAVAKPGPGGAEKGSGGLAADQVATPSTREIYDRAAGRPWPEMIAFSKAHLAKAPAVPAEYLYDALFGDTNTAKAPAARPQPAQPAPTMVAHTMPTGVPRTRPTAVPAPAAPAKVAITVPAQPTPAAPPTVKQAGMTNVARVGLSPAAGKLMSALDANAGVASAADALAPADVSVNGPVPTALLRAAEANTDPAARSACVRALARCKARTPGVVAGLERLVNDRNVDVRVEAAVALSDLKAK